MISRLRKTLALFFMLTLIAPAAFAVPGKDGTEAALMVSGSVDVDHSPADPLLLTLKVFNETKTVTVGQKKKALVGIVRFESKDADGRDVNLPIRPLAESAGIVGPAKLQHDQGIRLYFGVDTADLQKLLASSRSPMTIRALVNDASSRPVTLRLNPGAPLRPDTTGMYLRLDRRFEDLLNHADAMIRADAQKASGYIFRGDALYGLGRLNEALEPYGKAVELVRAQSKNSPAAEEPIYLIERINAILEQR